LILFLFFFISFQFLFSLSAFTFPFVVAHVPDGIEVIDLTAPRRIGGGAIGEKSSGGTPEKSLSSSLSSSGHRRLRNHQAIALNTPVTCSLSRHPLAAWIDGICGDGMIRFFFPFSSSSQPVLLILRP
jgi:hypothetical protein